MKKESRKCKRGFSTISVHGGEERRKPADSLTVPIFQTSTFVFRDSVDIKEYTSGRKPRFEYGRYGSPTSKAAENKLAEMECAQDALLFDSGMSAVTTTLLTFLSAGDQMVYTSDIYKKTYQFCRNELPRFGIQAVMVQPSIEAIAAALRPNTKLILSETPSNPFCFVLDMRRLTALAKKKNVMTIIDSTFATPVNQRPLEFGVDLIVHSATKYLAGHNDILSGVVLGSSENVQKVRVFQKIMGGVMDPHAIYLLIRGLKTLAIRVAHQNASAFAVARRLEKHKRIRKVWYLGLPSHPHHNIAKSQMKGFGGVVSFEIEGTLRNVQTFLRNLKLCQIAPSLGGTESLITHPAALTYYDMPLKERLCLGLTNQLIRLAVGVEDPDDIIADLEQALASMKK